MSIIDFKFENAARVLMESEDEVLQSAGIMALMRLETLKKRLRGASTKALSVPTNVPTDPFAPLFRSPWWHNSCNPPKFAFGCPPTNQGLFGSSPSTFGSAPAPAFGAAPPPAFGAAPAPAFGSAPASAFGSAPASTFGSAPAPAFGAAPTSTFGAPPPATTLFGKASGNAANPQSQNSEGIRFGAAQPSNASLGMSQPSNVTFGMPQPSNATFGTAQPSSGLFGAVQTQESNPTTTFGFPGPAQNLNQSESEPVPALSVPDEFTNQGEGSQDVDKKQLGA